MTRLLPVAAVALVAGLVGGVLPARAETARPNWLAVRVETGPEAAAYVRVTAHFKVQGDGTGPIIEGFANNAYEPRVRLSRFASTSSAVTTTTELGSTSVTIVPDGQGGFEGWSSSYRYIHRDQTDLTVFFVANASYTLLEHTTEVLDGSATFMSSQGSGADDITMAAPNDHGVAARVGGNAVGLSTHRASPPAGVIGSAQADWTAPDGRSSSGIFTGPAGDWSWTTLGVTSPWVGAYAPIGDDWVLLR